MMKKRARITRAQYSLFAAHACAPKCEPARRLLNIRTQDLTPNNLHFVLSSTAEPNEPNEPARLSMVQSGPAFCSCYLYLPQ